MKKLLLILLCLFTFASLYADPMYYHQTMSAAMSFDLAVTNRGPHNGPWKSGSREGKPSGGNYYDDDMIGVIGVLNNRSGFTNVEGVLVHIQLLNDAQFRTEADFSAYRNFGIEIIPKTEEDKIYNLTMYEDREMTIPIPKTTFYHICDNTNPEAWFKMYMNSPDKANSTHLWCDLIMIIDSAYEDDSLVIDDGYYANAILELYPIRSDGTVDESVPPYAFNFYCSGHYGTVAPDNFQLYNCFIEKENIADSFDLKADSAWDDYTKVASVKFSTDTRSFHNRPKRSDAGRDYRIIISPTSDYTSEAYEFQFNRNGGTYGKDKDTCFYDVAVVPEPVSRVSEYPIASVVSPNFIQIADTTSLTAYKNYYGTLTTPAISGNESVNLRQVQVPYYSVGIIPMNSNLESYVFNYEAGIYIKLTGFNGVDHRESLSSGLYSSSMYVTVISY